MIVLDVYDPNAPDGRGTRPLRVCEFYDFKKKALDNSPWMTMFLWRAKRAAKRFHSCTVNEVVYADSKVDL